MKAYRIRNKQSWHYNIRSYSTEEKAKQALTELHGDNKTHEVVTESAFSWQNIKDLVFVDVFFDKYILHIVILFAAFTLCSIILSHINQPKC